MPLNFYELYNLLNENTVSQELKKFKQSKKFKEKGVVQTLIEEIKKTKLPPNTLVNASENSKNTIANWILFNFFEFKEVTAGTLRWIDNATGKNDIRSAENYIDSLKETLTKSFSRSFTIQDYYDYIAASLDENGNLSQMLNSKFNDPKFKLQDLDELSHQYHEDLKKGKIRSSGSQGKTIIEFDNGYKWIDLERGYCSKEAIAGRHCGNVNTRPGDTILSLRDKKNYVHLTFILNNGILEERKAYANNKPPEKLHPFIIELLKLPIIKRLGPGRYLPENDFQLTDLNEEQIKELIELKPSFKKDYFRQLLTSEKEISKFSEDELSDHLWDYVDKNPSFLKNVKHPSLLKKIFEKVESLNNEHPHTALIFEYLADNSKTPGELLSKIFNASEKWLSSSDAVNKNLTKNKNTPEETLHKLAIIYKDSWEEDVGKIPQSFLDNLKNNLHAIMPQGRAISDIILNPNISIKTLEYLSSIDNKNISDEARNAIKDKKIAAES